MWFNLSPYHTTGYPPIPQRDQGGTTTTTTDQNQRHRRGVRSRPRPAVRPRRCTVQATPTTKQQETPFIRAQLDLLETDWNGDHYPRLFCATEPTTTQHLFRECPAWTAARAGLGIHDEEVLSIPMARPSGGGRIFGKMGGGV